MSFVGSRDLNGLGQMLLASRVWGLAMCRHQDAFRGIGGKLFHGRRCAFVSGSACTNRLL